MRIRPLRTDVDHGEAIREIERLWGAAEGTPEGDALDVWATLVDAYEARRWPVSEASPPELLRAAIADHGRTQDELAALLGSRSRASEVFGGRRRLTTGMVHTISAAWHIPAELLVRPYALSKSARPVADAA